MKRFYLIVVCVILTGLAAIIIPALNYNDYYQATKNIKKNLKLKEDPNFSDSSYAKYENESQFFISVIVPLSTKGIIKGKYIDKSNHGSPNIYIETEKYYFTICTFTELLFHDDSLFNYVLVDDSIFKNKGSAIYTIKRGNIIRNFKVGTFSEYWINPYYESSAVPQTP